jgi:alpha-amylase
MVRSQHTLFIAVVVAFVALLAAPCAARSPQDWMSRRIYQVLTDRFARPSSSTGACDVNLYCGGTFGAMTEHLDYIAGMGFNAIWISPVVVNYPQGYHGYWATDFFNINPHFGGAAELKAFVAAAHALDIWVMLDIVANHVGPVGEDYSTVVPFNSSEYYHKKCAVTSYVCESEEVQVCRLADLPDLNQDHEFVKKQLAASFQWLLTDFAFDGIRADTIMYIVNSYWNDLQNQLGTYIVGEVWADFACNLAYAENAIDATLNYPLYYAIRSGYQSGQSLNTIGDAWRQQQQLPEPQWEVNFIDNHDNDRFLQAPGATVPGYKCALAYLFFADGIPCVYYGTEQLYNGTVSDNTNREPLWLSGYNVSTDMYSFLKKLSAAHQTLQPWNYELLERWRDDTIYCLVRGALLLCGSNTPGTAQTRTIPNLPFEGYTMCDWMDASQPCVQGASTMTVTTPTNGNPLLWYATPSS